MALHSQCLQLQLPDTQLLFHQPEQQTVVSAQVEERAQLQHVQL
jgi:hypothetical protein